MPRISIITCTYNRAHLLGETIASVLRQTYADFEYLIVDDGSTDATAQVVASFTDARIKYHWHQRSGGHLSRLRNDCHSMVDSEFIAYADSDDLWEPDKLAIQLAGLDAHPNAGFSFTDVDFFDTRGTFRSSLYGKEGTLVGNVLPEILKNRLVICDPTLVLRRSCFKTIGSVDESMQFGIHDMAVRLAGHFSAFVVYRPLVHVRRHGGNTTDDHNTNLILMGEQHRTLGKLQTEGLISASAHRESIAVSAYSYGVQLRAKGDYDNAFRYFLQSFRLRWLSWKTWVRLLQVLPKKIFRLQP